MVFCIPKSHLPDVHYSNQDRVCVSMSEYTRETSSNVASNRKFEDEEEESRQSEDTSSKALVLWDSNVAAAHKSANQPSKSEIPNKYKSEDHSYRMKNRVRRSIQSTSALNLSNSTLAGTTHEWYRDWMGRRIPQNDPVHTIDRLRNHVYRLKHRIRVSMPHETLDTPLEIKGDYLGTARETNGALKYKFEYYDGTPILDGDSIHNAKCLEDPFYRLMHCIRETTHSQEQEHDYLGPIGIDKDSPVDSMRTRLHEFCYKTRTPIVEENGDVNAIFWDPED